LTSYLKKTWREIIPKMMMMMMIMMMMIYHDVAPMMMRVRILLAMLKRDA